MTLSISIDEQLARQAEQVAESWGMSLDQLIRRYLQNLTRPPSAEEDIAGLRRLSGRREATLHTSSAIRPIREMRGILRGMDTTVERDPDRV